ncbi:MAG TPA: FAD-dependent oxidoreductase [Candidatus Saccharimonadales bacterium]|nr:FAD-dependent oxidoreductase [Candidatus Saccharimonadales bacterium]
MSSELGIEPVEQPIVPLRFERAIVIGSGMGGIAAAAALRENCDDVVVLEKDEIPTQPISRRGVPQDEQLHNLLTRSQRHLEELLPGFCEALSQRGAGSATVSTETHVYELGVQMPERDIGLRLMSAWRPVIEYVARGILLDSKNIAFQGLSRVTGLVASDGKVEGVKLEDNKRLEAPLVIDATGTGSKAHKWFRELGIEEPRVDSLEVNQWYVSMLLNRPADFEDRNSFWLTFPTPLKTRGGLVSPVGTDNWYVSLSGRSQDTPPKSFDEMKQYAATLEESSIAKLLDNAQPLSSPNLFRKARATWRRYDLLADPLSGFLPLGDSIASLNPLFGQGMSVASWQAAELADLLKKHESLTLKELTTAYLGRAAVASEAAWSLGDLVNAETRETLTPDYWEKLATAIRKDADLHRQYVGVWHLIEPASTLYSPAFLDRIERAIKT